MSVHAAAARFVTDQPGIRTWHSFSAGPHYDPHNIAFGTVIGCDEHLVQPGAGFDWHSHRGVVIVSWIMSGTLRHEDDRGTARDIEAGGVLVQATGIRIRHRETNPHENRPLRFVQTTLLLDLPNLVESPPLPASYGDVVIDLARGASSVGPGFVVIGTSGATSVNAELDPGDTLRIDDQHALDARDGCLVIRFQH